jgi:membrane-bound acyltransferase YfiQ involved in biofilm formation
MGMMMSFPMMSLISPSIYILMCMMMAVSFVMTLAFGSIMSRMAVLSAFIAIITCVIMAVPSVVKSPIMPIKPQRRLADNQPEQNYCKAGKK